MRRLDLAPRSARADLSTTPHIGRQSRALDQLWRPVRRVVSHRRKADCVSVATATDESPGSHERTATHGDETEYEDTNGIRRKRDPHARDPGDDADGPNCGAAGDENRSKAPHDQVSDFGAGRRLALTNRPMPATSRMPPMMAHFNWPLMKLRGGC
jgi:hypothetical protein